MPIRRVLGTTRKLQRMSQVLGGESQEAGQCREVCQECQRGGPGDSRGQESHLGRGSCCQKAKAQAPWAQDRGAAVPLARSAPLGKFLCPWSPHLLVGKRGEIRKGF